MSLALNDDHRALAEVARSFLDHQGGTRAARELLDADTGALPPFWKGMADLGWLGLHLPEAVGGQGFGLPELAVVVEELGRVVAPGPFLPTAAAAAAVERAGTPDQHRLLLPGMADGSTPAAVAVRSTLIRSGDRIDGEARAVLGGSTAAILLLPVGDDLVALRADDDGVSVREQVGLDPTRRTATVRCDGVRFAPNAVLAGARPIAEDVLRVLAAAEACGLAHACVASAREHALTREQFGRVIGTFQAVKHHLADMLVAAELATAATWGAARSDGDLAQVRLAAAVAATQALPAAVFCAETNIQVHGGIGYTWEHDAHLYLRRASAMPALLDAATTVPADVAAHAAAGARTRRDLDLPREAERHRHEVREFRARLLRLPEAARRAAVLDSGYLVPHYPRPFGRGAGAVEQLVIEEELADLGELVDPRLGIGSWILPTLIQCGSPEQVDRWVRPSLEGELRWCQLFSEPSAGSDAAAIRTSARRVDGGWRISGQKVWTSDAVRCNRGLATVRTDRDAPKHAGVTMMAIDLRADGVTVRPLREITGEALFNEVFLDDVFVPDQDVVGEVGAGWAVARAALGNERVSIGGSVGGNGAMGADALLGLLRRHRPDDDTARRDVGRLIAEEEAMNMLNLRHAERAIDGERPGAEGNITKLLSAEHAQRVARLGVAVAGPAAVTGEEPELTHTLLYSRCLSIGGGTSEISRNQIAERLLGLPRDPLVK